MYYKFMMKLFLTVQTHTHTRTNTHTHTHALTHTHTRTNTHTHALTHTYIYMCTCTMHTRTHTQTQTHALEVDGLYESAQYEVEFFPIEILGVPHVLNLHVQYKYIHTTIHKSTGNSEMHAHNKIIVICIVHVHILILYSPTTDRSIRFHLHSTSDNMARSWLP